MKKKELQEEMSERKQSLLAMYYCESSGEGYQGIAYFNHNFLLAEILIRCQEIPYFEILPQINVIFSSPLFSLMLTFNSSSSYFFLGIFKNITNRKMLLSRK